MGPAGNKLRHCLALAGLVFVLGGQELMAVSRSTPLRPSTAAVSSPGVVKLGGVEYVDAADFAKKFGLKVSWIKSGERLALRVPPWGQGPITLDLRQAARLSLRVPPWARPGEVTYQVDQQDSSPGNAHIAGGYLELSPLPAGSRVQVWLGDNRRTTEEHLFDREYRIDWRNNAVTAVDPPGRVLSLYGKAP